MSLRIGFDMDGVVADFATAFQDIETRLFGHRNGQAPDQPEDEEQRPDRQLSETRRRRDQVWDEIRKTPDFWMTLRPLGNESVRRIHSLMLAHRWEVFFITQRPSTAGDTVQRQTQRWLVEHGFDLPSVLPIAGSRGTAAASFRLDYHVDDTVQHCLDVIADSSAKAILVSSNARENSIIGARKLGIAIASGIEQALDILEHATLAQSNPTLLRRLAALVGWR
jgi:5' nucleotidase, deoxy (Pyrimidine), cytosolic type C protein (NT5C)